MSQPLPQSVPRPALPAPGRLWFPLTLLGVWLAPRVTGRRLARRGVTSAIVAHLVALAGVVAVIPAVEAALRWAEAQGTGGFLGGILRQLADGMVSTAATQLGGVGTAIAILAIFLVAEICYWGLAIGVLGPAMGLDVPRATTLRKSIVVSGYASMWLIPLTAALGLAMVLYALSARMMLYVVSGRVVRLPWHEAGLALGISVSLTVLPACMLALALRLARGLGESPHPRPAGEDNLCEFCGYNLHATPFDQRCPECGQPAERSVSTIHRCNGWEVGQKSFARTALSILLDPARFFRTIRVRQQDLPARRFLAWATLTSAVLFGAVAVAGSIYSDWQMGRLSWAFSSIVNKAGFGVFLAGLWALAAMVMAMVAASALSASGRRRDNRISGCSALKIACYLSALTLPWSVLVGLLVGLTRHFLGLGLLGIGYQSTYTLTWIIVGVALLLWYWLVGTRAYAACQYANT